MTSGTSHSCHIATRLLIMLIGLLSRIPFRVLYFMSDLLFYPMYYVVRYRRKIVRRNLVESFPEKSLAEIKRIERGFYHFFIDMVFETCKLLTISDAEIAKRAKFINIEGVNKILKDGYSISAYTGHIGNWEWLSSVGVNDVYSGATVVQIYRRLQNKHMDEIMAMMRERSGDVGVEMRETVKYIAHADKTNQRLLIGFIADQSPKRRDSKYFIKFLNHEVPVLTGTEKLIKRFGHKAMFIEVKRVKRGYYTFEFKELCDNPASLPDFELTNMFFQRLEAEIRQQPECYLWTHNRFKYAKS